MSDSMTDLHFIVFLINGLTAATTIKIIIMYQYTKILVNKNYKYLYNIDIDII